MTARALVPAVVLVALIGAFAASFPAARDADRVRRIEHGLLLDRVVKGAPGMPLRERMAYYNVPAVSVAVVDRGQLAWARGYGVAEAGSSRAITPDTRFQAASISKPVTAMGALALVEQGAMRMDEDVNQRLTSWHVPENEFTRTQRVTVERLLGHTGGLGVDHFAGYGRAEPVPTLLQALDGRAPANSPAVRVERVPGSARQYSGGGYLVLQQLMIDVTGAPFPTVLQRLVFDKLGMRQSSFEPVLPDARASFAATGHDSHGAALAGRWHTYPEAAAAGLWTTPSDLARLVIELQQSLHGRSNRVLSAETTRRMVTSGAQGEALGFSAWGSGPTAVFSHGGANDGFRTIVVAYANTGRGAVLMANGDGADALLNEIQRAIAREYGWPDYRPTEKVVVTLDPAVASRYVGQYDADGTPVFITRDGSQLYLQTAPMGPAPLKLHASDDQHLFLLEADIDLTFTRDGQGRVTALNVNAMGTTASARRLTP